MTEPVIENQPRTVGRRGNASVGRAAAVGLFLILTCAGFLRFHDLAGASLWMDEIWSIEAASGRGVLHNQLPANVIRADQVELTGLADAPPWTKVWSPATDLRHPPLYYLLLRWWMDFFGNDPGAVRALSALISLASVLVFFDVCRWFHGTGAALLAAGMMAVAAVEVSTGQDARNYVLAGFLSLCFADALARIEKRGASGATLAGLAMSAVAMLLTHYLCAGVGLVGGVYALVHLRGRDRARTVATLLAAVMVTAAIWGAAFHRQMASFPTSAPDFLLDSGEHHGWDTFLRAVGLPGQYVLGEEFASRQSAKVLAALAALVLVMPLLRLWRRTELLFWMLWLAGTLGLVIALDLARQTQLLLYVRYTILAAPAVYALLAVFDWPKKRMMNHALAIAVLIAMTIIAGLRLGHGVESKEDWRELSQSLDAHAGADELLVFYGNGPWISPGMFYMGFKYYSPNSQRPWLILHERVDAAMLRQLSTRNSLWLIGFDPRHDGPDLLPGWGALSEERTTAGAMCQMVRVLRVGR